MVSSITIYRCFVSRTRLVKWPKWLLNKYLFRITDILASIQETKTNDRNTRHRYELKHYRKQAFYVLYNGQPVWSLCKTLCSDPRTPDVCKTLNPAWTVLPIAIRNQIGSLSLCSAVVENTIFAVSFNGKIGPYMSFWLMERFNPVLPFSTVDILRISLSLGSCCVFSPIFV